MMEEKEIFRKVGEILNELNDQYNYLSKAGENVNELEIELFVANANFLADHIKIVQKLKSGKKSFHHQPLVKENKNIKEAADEDIKKEDVVTAKQAGQATDKDNTEEPGSVLPVKPGEIKFEFGRDDIKEQEEIEGDHGKPDAEDGTVVREVVIREKTVSVDTAVKDPAEHLPTVNELLSSDKPTVAARYNKQTVDDLKTIINLNDKLMFVKDLFNGYSLAYSEAIELLNRFDNFEAADNFLKKNYAVKNNWSERQATVDKFYEILNRRFTK